VREKLKDSVFALRVDPPHSAKIIPLTFSELKHIRVGVFEQSVFSFSLVYESKIPSPFTLTLKGTN
jgi:hypothetical protein